MNLTVYKNTLVKRAIAGTEYEGLGEALKGSSAFAFCEEDATSSARLLKKAMKQYNKMSFKGGYVDGSVYDAKQVEALADIPIKRRAYRSFHGKHPVTIITAC